MAEERLVGRGAAPGLVQGRVSVLESARPGSRTAGPPEDERAALVLATRQALMEVRAAAARLGSEAADMLGVHAALLEDENLVRPALVGIAGGAPAHVAWAAAMAVEARDATPAYAADLEDIRDRVLALLCPGGLSASPSPGAVVAAVDLPLSRFLSIDWTQGGGIVLTSGSPASHVATLARARSVPMVVGVGGAVPRMAGRTVLVDATAGEVVLDPGEAARAAFAARMSNEAAGRLRRDAFRAGPAVTRDGTRIAVNLNIGGLQDLAELDPALCDGVGLVRTELLFHGGGLPDEETQYAAYRRIVDWAAGRKVVVRTLDTGGDKPMAGVTPPYEGNAFMGLRGLRLSLLSPGPFRVQLRALSRAAAHGNLRVMLPMVTIPEEVAHARALLDDVLRELEAEGVPARRPMLGIMIEVPAAAISVDRFDAEFYSIGSNDLTQYVMAAGRDIGTVAGLADPLNPAVLKLIETVARHGRMVGREVGLCGDAAADPRCLGSLLRAGLRSISVAPQALGRTKEAVAAVDLREVPT